MSAKVGADIENLCTKCGDVWHVVVAKVGDRIVKVQCKECSSVHRHRPPEGSAAAAKTKTARPASTGAPTAAGTSAPKKSVAKKAEARMPEPLVAADPSRPPRNYRPTDTFQIGDRLIHTSFGSGIVETFPGPGKMQVFFPSGRRILALTKAASSLAPPPPRSDDEPVG